MTLAADRRKLARLARLFDADAPSVQRALAVLADRAAGLVWVDDPKTPRRVIVRERSFGLTFFAGFESNVEWLEALDWARATATAPHVLLDAPAGAAGHTHIELWDGDPRIDAMPEPTVLGRSVVFSEGRDPIERVQPPPAFRLVDADPQRFRHAEWHEDQIDIFGSEAAFFEHGLGRFLMHGEAIVCEAYAEFQADGRWEVGVVTAEQERGRGYAYLTCADLLAEVESRGYEAVWHAAASNEASVALGRKLGFRRERRGPLFCYEPQIEEPGP